jgi:hypothetical protein
MVLRLRRPPHSFSNRRTANLVSHGFARLIEHAVQIGPTTYRAIVAAPTPA